MIVILLESNDKGILYMPILRFWVGYGMIYMGKWNMKNSAVFGTGGSNHLAILTRRNQYITIWDVVCHREDMVLYG